MNEWIRGIIEVWRVEDVRRVLIWNIQGGIKIWKCILVIIFLRCVRIVVFQQTPLIIIGTACKKDYQQIKKNNNFKVFPEH
ncbi:MAG: hypothetical protein PH343_00825 [Nitrospira sp.]|nr:hypothetical protein [Nitrospira sp.]